MDITSRYIIILLLLCCVTQQVSVDMKRYFTIPWENEKTLTHIPNMLSYDQEGEWNVTRYASSIQAQPGLLKLTLPYLEYDSHGIVVNYTTSSKNKESVATLINDQGEILPLDVRGLFPKIAFPYILGVSPDRTYVKIFKIQDHEPHFIKDLFLKDILTSQAASPDGRFLLLGTLSSSIVVLDTRDWEKSQQINVDTVDIPISHPKNTNIYGVSITNNGKFILLVNKPYQVVIGGVQDKKIYTYPLSTELLTPKIHPIFVSDHVFSFGYNFSHAFYFDKENIKPILSFISRPYPIFNMVVTKSGYIATLYHKYDHLFLLDIQTTGSRMLAQSMNIISNSIPIFHEEKGKTYLLYQKGIIPL